MYRIEIDTDACEGIFACLVRDDRFVEREDGLAGLDAETAEDYRDRDGSGDGAVVAEFDDDRLEDARQAATACPPGAITVEEVGTEGTEAGDDPGEAETCR